MCTQSHGPTRRRSILVSPQNAPVHLLHPFLAYLTVPYIHRRAGLPRSRRPAALSPRDLDARWLLQRLLLGFDQRWRQRRGLPSLSRPQRHRGAGVKHGGQRASRPPSVVRTSPPRHPLPRNLCLVAGLPSTRSGSKPNRSISIPSETDSP